MFSYLLTALAAALCLLGALMIYANFHFLLEQQRGKNTSFMPCLGYALPRRGFLVLGHLLHSQAIRYFRLLVCRGVAGYWCVDTASFAYVYDK